MLQPCLLVQCTATQLHTLCMYACFTFGHEQETLYTLCKPRLLDHAFDEQAWPEESSKPNFYILSTLWQPNCNMDRSLSQARCAEAASKPQQWCCFTLHKTPTWVATCLVDMLCFYHSPRDCLSYCTFGPQRGPLVAQQSSVLHTLHLIQSQPSFFCTITPHWEQRMASPWVNMR